VTSTGGQGRESDHEEVQTREGDHVHGQFSEVRVQLAGETETGRHAGHDGRDEVVEISVRGGVEFQGAETDVVEGLVVDTERLVRVLDELLRVKLLYREGGEVHGRTRWRCKARRQCPTP
jgi:hypothetical protein